MSNFIPQKRTIRRVVHDPSWWTSIAVNLATVNLPATAIELSKFLKKEDINVYKNLAELYNDAFIESLKDFQHFTLDIKPIQRELEIEELQSFDPNFPMAFTYFRELLQRLKFEMNSASDSDIEVLEKHIRENFGRCFEEVRVWHTEKYSSANRYIEFLNTSLDTVEGEVIRHTRSILEKVGFDPLPIDPSLTLWEIYVPPSAKYWNEKVKNKDGDNFTVDTVNLIDSLLEVIEGSKSPIIIHGQPGHGKTSAVRMLVHALTFNNNKNEDSKPANILMYEFKDLGRLDLNELEILQKRTPFVKDESFFRGKNTILIIDGMDERQIADGNDITLKDFIRNMFVLSIRLNKDQNTKFNLIMTGRSQFVRYVQPSFASEYHQYEIKDFSLGQIQRWLTKYSICKKITPSLVYGKFESMKITELIFQPILLHICSLLLSDPRGKKLLDEIEEEQITRGKIYETIIKFTYEKKWQNHPNRSALPDEESYNRLLKIISFVLFKKGTEIIKIGDLAQALEKDNRIYNLDYIKLNEPIEPILRTLAVSFFFEGLEQNAFSFIHKTISDYLTVEALTDLVVETVESYNPKRIETSCNNMAEDLYLILGSEVLMPVAYREFLRDIMRMRKDRAISIFRPLESFFKLCQTHTYLGKHGIHIKDNPLATEANVLYGLLELIVAIFVVLDSDQRKEIYADGFLNLFPNVLDFFRFYSLLNSIPDIFLDLDLNYINLNDALMHSMNLSGCNLVYTTLQNSKLFGATINGSELQSADFQSAFIVNSTFRLCDLRQANFKHAILYFSDFSKATLEDSDLSFASMREVRLKDTNLTNSVLNSADIIDSDLTNIRLIESNLENAAFHNVNMAFGNLKKARMTNITFADCILNDCYFIDAKLEDANLINSKMIHANFYNANLTNAELINTDMKNAFLRGANLSNANLTNADLTGAYLKDCNLANTNLTNANLANVRGLTEAQINQALISDSTILPTHFE